MQSRQFLCIIPSLIQFINDFIGILFYNSNIIGGKAILHQKIGCPPKFSQLHNAVVNLHQVELYVVFQPTDVTTAEKHMGVKDIWPLSVKCFIRFFNIIQNDNSPPSVILLTCQLHNVIFSFSKGLICIKKICASREHVGPSSKVKYEW